MLELENLGYSLTDLVLSAEDCDQIISAVPGVSGGRGGVRNLIQHPTVVRLLLNRRLGEFLSSAVGRELVAVKATLFDKTVRTNWRVQWHQDGVVAVKERADVPGYGPWSSKSGSLHVGAPAAVLGQMIAARIHIDACGPENGPLVVIPGSHRLGKVPERRIANIVATSPRVELCVQRGAIVLMRPLLLHSSSPSRAPEHRRVLHVELAPRECIFPLQWESAVSMLRAA